MSGIMLNIAGGSFAPSVPTVIGAAYGGGFFAGQISTAGNSVADFNLVVGPKSTAESTLIQWKTANTDTTGTSSVIDGPSNSSNMNNATHPAAQFCEGRTIGGFNDWYMPAKNELEICYYNLKPGTTNNNTAYGVNANAVPARASNYTSGDPAQTSATDFRAAGTEPFSNISYWNSTQNSTTKGWVNNFDNGFFYFYTKTSTLSVRAVRRVAV